MNLEDQEDTMIQPEAYQKHCMIIEFNQLMSSTAACSNSGHRIMNTKYVNSYKHQLHVSEHTQDGHQNMFKLNGCVLLK